MILPDFVRFNHERHIQRFVFKQKQAGAGSLRLLPWRYQDDDGCASPEAAHHGLVR